MFGSAPRAGVGSAAVLAWVNGVAMDSGTEHSEHMRGVPLAPEGELRSTGGILRDGFVEGTTLAQPGDRRSTTSLTSLRRCR